jgi:hypothetical protein
VRDAAALLKAKRYSAAYYLAGYAVECALKACVVAYLKKNLAVIFRDRRFSEKCWTHDFKRVVHARGFDSPVECRYRRESGLARELGARPELE